jgi:hypothetical protein
MAYVETMNSKRCNRCKEVKLLSDFGNDSGGKKLRSDCRACDSILAKERSEIRKTAPSIPDNHVCPICEQTEEQLNENINPTLRKKGRPWVMDHNHELKTFRGWLCRKCNLGCGNFKDNPELLEKAAKYLRDTQNGK